ncbi:MAG: hypothetical protein LJE83_05490 [Gammaproteobacteria bacterium]|jgi:hypothetical protein|nr:hypothetical protein [Gammaproteobacteria bacterium]
MSKKSSVTNIEKVERRRHWRDRRNGSDRRNSGRLRFTGADCRSGIPRRDSDLGGELAEGEIWWNKDVTRYE